MSQICENRATIAALGRILCRPPACEQMRLKDKELATESSTPKAKPKGSGEAKQIQVGTLNGTTFQPCLNSRVADAATFNILNPDPRNIALFRRFLGR